MIDDRVFKSTIAKLRGQRKHKITKSYGNKQAWRWIKKNKWINIKQPISEKLFGLVIKKVNTAIRDKVISGGSVVLPYNMGILELVKYKAKLQIINNKIETNLPIDWNNTLKYWNQDKDAFKNKKLIRIDNKEIFKIRYSKRLCKYKNKNYFNFYPNRQMKIKLKDKIINKETDTLLIDYGRIH